MTNNITPFITRAAMMLLTVVLTMTSPPAGTS